MVTAQNVESFLYWHCLRWFSQKILIVSSEFLLKIKVVVYGAVWEEYGTE